MGDYNYDSQFEKADCNNDSRFEKADYDIAG